MEKNATDMLQRNLKASIEAKQLFATQTGALEIFQRAADAAIASYKAGGRLYIAGNGGSAADAQHLAAEFVSRLARERTPLPAEALTVDTSIITAIGNDYGYEHVFSRQIAAKMTAKDIFLGITTSGKSPNIVKALEMCRSMGIPTIIFTGHQGGTVKDLADYCIIAPGTATSTIQEIHIVLAHTLCEAVETAICA